MKNNILITLIVLFFSTTANAGTLMKENGSYYLKTSHGKFNLYSPMPNGKLYNSHWGSDLGTVSYSKDHSIAMIQRTVHSTLSGPKKSIPIESDYCEIFNLNTGCILAIGQDDNCDGKWIGNNIFRWYGYDTNYNKTYIPKPSEFLEFYKVSAFPSFSLKSYEACYPVTKDNQMYYKEIKHGYRAHKFSP
ncbi:hypothetical protein M9194_21460 [Vibrio sp. S4M6]|uniref:hypothetical protein n=1 Tax=Vibrio sinus TaxID=2946865 RepID=UPI00202AB7C5|nr:hypothetical protein [Vibrio sinus]MCL9783991.1 hypothetical protein [Vibrio sinus]